MDSTDNTIQPSRGAPDKGAPVSTFAGTVTGVRQDSGTQTVDVQYSQGKLRLQADGDFQVGERIKLSIGNGGSVQVEKAGAQAEAPQAGGVSYTLPGNMAVMKDIGAFEEQLAQFMGANGEPGAGASGGAGANAKAAAGLAQNAFQQMSLPDLLGKVLDQKGGRDFVGQLLATLGKEAFSTLVDGLDGAKGDLGTSLADVLKELANAPDGNQPADNVKQMLGGNTAATQGGRGAAGGISGAYWPGEVGAGAAPLFGQVLEKSEANNFLQPLQRLQYGGAGGPPKSDPLYRYMMDMGGRTMEVYSAQSKNVGEFADFQLERGAGRLQANFLDPTTSLPANARAAFAQTSPDMKQAFEVASHYLQEFKDEPYFGQLVQDFSEVLAQSGRLDSATGAGGAQVPQGLPSQKDLDGLLKLFVAFPRDTQQPAAQAKIWGDASRDPQAVMNLLKTLRPDQDASLLRSATPLHLAQTPGLPGQANPSLPGVPPAAADGPEATAAWLRKALPEAFRSADLIGLVEDKTAAASDPKENQAAKFLLQAVANALPRDDQQVPPGSPTQFYFYQAQEWKGLQVTWQKGQGKNENGKGGPKEPVKVRVETNAKLMGKVDVGLSLDPKGARLDFKNQHYNVRDLLADALPELNRNLSMLDFNVVSFTYDQFPDETPPAQAGWVRPAGLSDGSKLDLMG